MRLALLTDYALRTLIYLVGKPGRANIHEVADFYRISPIMWPRSSIGWVAWGTCAAFAA